ncbi:hypothetical protein KAR48_18225 [bacterium]|nr:hypothetical protein [bacterium]
MSNRLFRPISSLLLILAVLSIPALSNGQEKSKWSFGFTERLRYITWNNAIDLDSNFDDESSFTRHRTCFSANFSPNSSLSIAVKLTNEFRNYFKPDNRDFEIHELILDQLYMDWKRPAGLPLDLKLGRQNMILGEGFVIMDGHPLDGSRSIYFNGGRMDLHLTDSHKITLFGVRQNITDDILPVINDQDQRLIEQPEEGFGLYYSGRHGKVGLDLYAIRKNILGVTVTQLPGSAINTIGLRSVIPVFPALSVTAEAAYQAGTYNSVDRKAWGGYFHADYIMKQALPFPATITLGGIGLSGDDPDTKQWEGWDPLFSRWPKWSESYIYTLIREFGRRVAYWSNFTSIYAGMTFKVAEPVQIKLQIHRLGAMHESITSSGFPGGGGLSRGTLFIAKMNYQLNKQLSGHVLFETFSPGNYYAGNLDSYHWFRCELLYSWRS